MDASKLTAHRPSDPCAIQYNGETLTVRFDEHAVTPYRISVMQQGVAEADLAAMAEFLSDVLIEWDMTNNGNPQPIEYEFLVNLPQSLISAIFQAVVEGMGGGKARSENRGGSRTTSQERRRQAQGGR